MTEHLVDQRAFEISSEPVLKPKWGGQVWDFVGEYPVRGLPVTVTVHSHEDEYPCDTECSLYLEWAERNAALNLKPLFWAPAKHKDGIRDVMWELLSACAFRVIFVMLNNIVDSMKLDSVGMTDETAAVE